MRRLRVLLHRIAGVFQRERGRRDFRRELDAHLQLHVEDNRRLGMTEEEARRQALLRLGGLGALEDAQHDRRGLPLIETAARDLRFAARMLRRTPGFTTVVIVTLAIGIGANAVMFTVVNTLLLRPLPFPDPHQLVIVQTINARRQPAATAAPDFYAYREGNRTLAYLDAYYTRPYNLTGGREPERIPTLIASSGLLASLGVQAAHGRGFVRPDEEWGSHRVAILSDGLWRRRFGSDPAIVGRPITLNLQPYTVVGVLPPGFSFADAQLIVPMSFEPGDNMNSHSNYFLRMAGRLRPGVTPEEAMADLNVISAGIIATQSVNQGTAIDIVPLRDAFVARDVRRAVLVLFGAVGFVLLITCANLANLLLARAAARQREIAVRLALGATRSRLLRQFLVESLLLSAIGALAGLIVAYVATDALNLISPRILPRPEPIRVDPVVLLFTSAVAMATGLLIGAGPALFSARSDVNEGLKEGARNSSEAPGRQRLRSLLVVAEVALSLVLLAGAGLTIKSVYQLLQVDGGFDPEGVLTMQVNLPAEKYVDRRLERTFSPDAYIRAVAFLTAVVDGVRAEPGVRAVGATNGLPLLGHVWGKNVTLYDRPLPADVRGLQPIQYRVVAGDYFRAMGVRIVSGRAFTDRDTAQAPRVAIVNRALVRRDWDGADPIGKVLSVNPPLELLPQSVIDEARKAGTLPDGYTPDKFTVVGVADDVLYGGLDGSAVPLVYVPYAQGSEGTLSMFLVVRTDGDPLALTAAIKERIARIDRDQPVALVQTMSARMQTSVAQRRVQMNVLGGFAALAVLLAGIGIYGMMSYAVAQRARELGIRLALGADRSAVTALVLRKGFVMVGAGVAIGLAGAAAITRVLSSLLFQVSPTDPWVFAAIVLLLSAIGWVAAYLPARRAARFDPLIALRSE